MESWIGLLILAIVGMSWSSAIFRPRAAEVVASEKAFVFWVQVIVWVVSLTGFYSSAFALMVMSHP